MPEGKYCVLHFVWSWPALCIRKGSWLVCEIQSQVCRRRCVAKSGDVLLKKCVLFLKIQVLDLESVAGFCFITT